MEVKQTSIYYKISRIPQIIKSLGKCRKKTRPLNKTISIYFSTTCLLTTASMLREHIFRNSSTATIKAPDERNALSYDCATTAVERTPYHTLCRQTVYHCCEYVNGNLMISSSHTTSSRPHTCILYQGATFCAYPNVAS